MDLDHYFTHGLKSFLIVTAVTTAVCTIMWLSVEKKINRYNLRHPGHEAPTRFIAAAVRLAFFIIGLLIIMDQIAFLQPAVNMVFDSSSVVVICCTIAAKESIGNYIAGFMLSLSKPFKIGDTVCLNVQRIKGSVTEITFRHTVIQTESGTIALIPNSVMNSTAIVIEQSA